MNGLPMTKISVTALILVAIFAVCGTVLAVTGHADLANGAFGNITGILLGGGATVVHVARSNGNGNGKHPPTTLTQ